MHQHAHHQEPFPLFPLLGAGFLILATLVSVAWLQWFGGPQGANHQGAITGQVQLHFRDREDGGVDVLNADDQRLISRLEPGNHGFVRATLRGLARSRRAIGAGSAEPFRLERRDNGQLILIDPVTGQEVDLWAFGSLNAGEFEALLDAAGKSSGDLLNAEATEELSGAHRVALQQDRGIDYE